ncbi:MAG: ribonuclease HI [Spirochaetaceae bacterium]|jgi:ribonuclease HI|nr:ribonuclease HI [Spirochaetaceae bacterium]
MGIKIYTDGGCSGNPGPGGWAYIIVRDNKPDAKTGKGLPVRPSWAVKGAEEEIIAENYGGEPDTTNNRMELTAVIAALEALSKLKLPVEVFTVFTDSQYVQKGMSVWLKNWKRNSWRTSDRKPVKNRDLWEHLDELAGDLLIDWQWIKGHAGNEYNERCDRMTQRAVSFLQGQGGGSSIGCQRYFSFWHPHP